MGCYGCTLYQRQTQTNHRSYGQGISEKVKAYNKGLNILFSFIFQIYLYDDEDGVEAIDRRISVNFEMLRIPHFNIARLNQNFISLYSKSYVIQSIHIIKRRMTLHWLSLVVRLNLLMLCALHVYEPKPLIYPDHKNC